MQEGHANPTTEEAALVRKVLATTGYTAPMHERHEARRIVDRLLREKAGDGSTDYFVEVRQSDLLAVLPLRDDDPCIQAGHHVCGTGTDRRPTYDHEWVSGIINQNNERGRLLIECEQEIDRLRKALHRCREDHHAKVIALQRKLADRV